MLHLQDGVQDWPKTIRLMPEDGVLIKSVNDPSKLKEAVDVWLGLGRQRRNLLTVFRFNDLEEIPANEDAKPYARRQLFRFIDGTYLRQYAKIVDRIETKNEYTATSAWTDAERTRVILRNVRTYVDVWNNEFRGRWVVSPDGGEGFIPADCKMAICNGPVSNWIHRGFFELARDEDCSMSYHPYIKCVNGVRVADDWVNHSGLQHRMEDAFGIPVEWLYTEFGPYLNTDFGWRWDDCLGADPTKLIEVTRAWIRDEVQTRAFRERRTWTPAHFTQGGGLKWRWYELEYPQLTALSMLFTLEWKRPPEVDMDEQVKAYYRGLLQEASDALEGQFMIEITNPNVGYVNLRNGPGTLFLDVGDARTGSKWVVYEVAPNGWCRIKLNEQVWVTGSAGFIKRLP